MHSPWPEFTDEEWGEVMQALFGEPDDMTISIPLAPTKKLCSCDMQLIMSSGCKCGGE